jgi:uncharacterized protein DUF5996
MMPPKPGAVQSYRLADHAVADSIMTNVSRPPSWPSLPLAEWVDTQATLHRWLQIVGKTRLQFSPAQNHWWHTPLYLSARGLGTSPMADRALTFEIELDFIEHALVVRTGDGREGSMPLQPMAVADFYRAYLALCAQVGIRVRIQPVPVEMPDRLRFDEDRLHAAYDADAAHRCWRLLAQADRVLKAFRGRFLGKSSPVHFWWGAFDLSCTRFSGRSAPLHPGGIPNCPDFVTREAYSHECSSVGWWPGSAGVLEEPAFYAYAYPEPAGYGNAAIQPAAAYYHAVLREWVLPYEAVRTSADPDAALLAFCESTYAAAADLGRWDRAALERTTQGG